MRVSVQDTIFRIKIRSNEEFDEVFARKEAELMKIKEKNVRIRQILHDIGMPEETYEPTMCSIEKPEMLFTTTDDEVDVLLFFS